jgi:hypothetical protein
MVGESESDNGRIAAVSSFAIEHAGCGAVGNAQFNWRLFPSAGKFGSFRFTDDDFNYRSFCVRSYDIRRTNHDRCTACRSGRGIHGCQSERRCEEASGGRPHLGRSITITSATTEEFKPDQPISESRWHEGQTYFRICSGSPGNATAITAPTPPHQLASQRANRLAPGWRPLTDIVGSQSEPEPWAQA